MFPAEVLEMAAASFLCHSPKKCFIYLSLKKAHVIDQQRRLTNLAPVVKFIEMLCDVS